MKRLRRSAAVLAASALLVPLLAGTASGQEPSSTPTPAPQDKGSKHYLQTWLINDPELAANPQRVVDTLRRTGSLETLGLEPVTGMKTPVPYQQQPAAYTIDSSRFAGGAKPADPYQYATEQECATSRKAVREQGWIKNHFSYCQRTLMVRRHLRCGPRGCRLAGMFMGMPTVTGHGKHGGYPEEPTNRWAHFEFQLNPLLVTGPYRRADFTVRFQTDGEYPEGGDWFADPCKIGEKDGRDDSLQSWMASDGAEIELVSEADAPSAEQGEEIATCTFHPVYDFDMPGWDADQPIHGYQGSMRFDSAWYLAPKDPSRQLGSVFDRTTPGMVYRRDDAAVAGVADHIGDARANPAATVPPEPGKTLEGATPSDTLRRLAPGVGQAQQERYAANGRLARRFCRKNPEMPPKPGPDYDCDEYAFASTYEGAARYRYEGQQYYQHYSVRWVDSNENQEAGRRLGRWYINQRILDGNEFFVPIN